MNAHCIAIHFAEALGRHRALTDEESTLLEQVIAPEKRRRVVWTRDQDRRLEKMRAHMSAPQIAREMGRSAEAVRVRMKRLRRKEKANG